MKKRSLALLTLLLSLGFARCDSSNSPPPDTRKLEEASISTEKPPPKELLDLIEKNPLLKELSEVVKDDKGYISEKGQNFLATKVEEVYKKMNVQLARKDIPNFVYAYQDALAFSSQLKNVGSCYVGGMGLKMFFYLNKHYWGNIYTKVMSNPEILQNWPSDCPSSDSEAKELAHHLFNFDRNRRLRDNEKIDDESNAPGHYIFHDDQSLALVTNKNLHSDAASTREGRYFLDGTYTDMRFSLPANIMVYALIKNDSNNLLESTVSRCSFIDLGLDGIDSCDARLNGLKESEIKSANEKAKECMKETIGVLKKRYAGMGFIE